MKTLFAILLVSMIAAPSFAKENGDNQDGPKPVKACMKAAEESIANSRDSDATFEQVEGDEYVFGVSRGSEDACFYDIRVKVKKHSDGSCTAGKAEFDGSSANCG